ncbi:hypothetical protein F3J45_00590 [Pantoea sp. Ap-967]|uniref:hypothetical protein n=1 Tax=Pantoea sp. Ap-967 TaxID=2608362 RepID=UPI00141FDC3D|nr:hypothetical protein [Pantoea sp. Ap-967]NIE72963.1 hypothetical protein [Pantoea sp. Ap-967]
MIIAKTSPHFLFVDIDEGVALAALQHLVQHAVSKAIQQQGRFMQPYQFPVAVCITCVVQRAQQKDWFGRSGPQGAPKNQRINSFNQWI